MKSMKRVALAVAAAILVVPGVGTVSPHNQPADVMDTAAAGSQRVADQLRLLQGPEEPLRPAFVVRQSTARTRRAIRLIRAARCS